MSYYVLGKLFGRDIFESIFLERLTNFSFANKRCLLFNLLPIFLFLVTSGSKELHAQHFLSNQDDSYLRPITFDEAAFNTLYDTIHARLAQPYGDTARTYVAESILQFCGEDYDCQINLHHRLRDSLFENSHYLIALELGRTSAQLALKNEDPYNVGLAYVDLSFYYHDLGRGDSMVALLERSLIHFEESGACYRQFKVRTELLERKHGRKPKEIVPLMEKNLEDALQMGCSGPGLQHVLKRLMEYTERGGLWVKHLKYMDALERSIDPKSEVFEHRHAAIYTNLGRAKLYLRESPKKMEKANKHLLKALDLCYEIPYPLFGVEILYRLARLEWSRQNKEKAFAYLEEAIDMGKENKVLHYLSIAYSIKAEYMEKQGRYKEALEAARNDYRYRKEYREMLVGLNLRDYYMEIEKDQMAASEKNRVLQLQLKDSQLRNSAYIIVSILLLSLLLLYGFNRQRKRKSELAKQNILIQRQTEQLKRLDKAKSRFFANVSHELRTPISLVSGPISTIRNRKNLNTETQQLLNIANQGVQNLQVLVDEILDLGKLESGKMELVSTPIRVVPFFKQYFAQFESLGTQKSIAYRYEIKVSDETTVLLDKEKCRQLIYNLLSNAFKFTASDGEVRAAVRLQDKQIHLTVSDTGKGIHQDDLPYVFDRYFQTSRPEVNADGGTGIGLALCKEYAHLFGGQINVESKIGEGTSFYVSFPVEINEQPLDDENSIRQALLDNSASQKSAVLSAMSESSLAVPESNSDKPTILVVEDNPELQAYIQIVLKDSYNVLVAENGKVALDKLATHQGVELIISDIMMRVMDGYQLLEKVKGNTKTQQLPFIMLTARADKDDRLKALRIGVDDYLTKPFDEEELLVRINNLLINYAARKAAVQSMVATELPNEPKLPAPDQEWLTSFEKYVQENLSNNHLSVLSLAEEFAMSQSTLLRQLKRLTGLTPKKYLLEVRLVKARQLLEQERYGSISRIALEVGYSDVYNFSKSFKKRFDKNPSDYLID